MDVIKDASKIAAAIMATEASRREQADRLAKIGSDAGGDVAGSIFEYYLEFVKRLAADDRQRLG